MSGSSRCTTRLLGKQHSSMPWGLNLRNQPTSSSKMVAKYLAKREGLAGAKNDSVFWTSPTARVRGSEHRQPVLGRRCILQQMAHVSGKHPTVGWPGKRTLLQAVVLAFCVGMAVTQSA